jgi:phage FluMu gp28-like protein
MKAKIIPANHSVLLPYQTRWIQDRSRLKIAEKSRQIGWTWATACGQVLRKCQRKARLDSWISST